MGALAPAVKVAQHRRRRIDRNSLGRKACRPCPSDLIAPADDLAMMRAMTLHAPGEALRLEERPDLDPAAGEVRLKVQACAVCRTDLHIVDGELPLPRLPVVPGHEIVGIVAWQRG